MYCLEAFIADLLAGAPWLVAQALAGVPMSPMEDLLDELMLIGQCLEGEKASWDALYRRHNDHILRVIAACLAEDAAHQDRVEDLAERMWVELWRNPKRLLRYDPRRASLASFLGLLARYEVRLYRRRLERLKVRPRALGEYDPSDPRAVLGISQAEFDEFLSGLPDRLREFVAEQLRECVAKRPMTDAERQRLMHFMERLRAYFHGS